MSLPPKFVICSGKILAMLFAGYLAFSFSILAQEASRPSGSWAKTCDGTA